MEVAKRVKSKKLYSDSQPSFGVKLLKKKPAKVSLPVASKTKGIKKKPKEIKPIKIRDKVETSTEQNAKPKDKKVKTTKKTKEENEVENEANDTEAEVTEPEVTQAKAKKPKGLATAKKTKETNTAAGTSKSEVPKKKPKAVNKVQKTEETDKKTKLIEEVFEAITAQGIPRKGASSQAIKNYIFSKRGIDNEDASHKRVNKLINNALRKAVENGELERPASSKGDPSMPSAIGRFVLPKKPTKPKVPKKPQLKETKPKIPKKPQLKEESEAME